MLEKGKKVGEYVLLEKLGAGGFGDVWKAEKRTVLDVNHFALKFFRPKQDGVDFDKIGKELAVWKQLRGLPHIISVIELDRFEDYVYVVSDFADGGSLETWLKNNGKASTETEAVRIALEILTGLENLHGKNFVHRDLKPDNILIMNGRHCLADFGISREIKTHSKATGTAGTMEYMPPEAFEKTPSVTPQTDIWAVGAILQRLLTGKLPYPQDDQPSLIAAILMSEPDEMPESVSESLREIVKKSLQKNREDHFESANEMREVLREVLMRQKLVESQKPSQAKTFVLEDSDKTAKLEIAPIQEDNERETELRSFQTEIKTVFRQQINEASERIGEDADKTEQLVIEPIKDWREIETEKKRQAELEQKQRKSEIERQKELEWCRLNVEEAKSQEEIKRRKQEVAKRQETERKRLEIEAKEKEQNAAKKKAIGIGIGALAAMILGGLIWTFSSNSLSNVATNKATNTTSTNSGNPNTFKNSIGMEFVKIPSGSFMMGSPTSEAEYLNEERPQHQVTISKNFYLGKYEVTQGQWKAVMGNNPSYFSNCGDNCPVEGVSWEDAQEFIKRLNERGEGTYRLPTEAEWEYACRAGTTGAYSGNLDEMGWYDENSGSKTHRVGQKKANAFGLYDMHGNVYEWTADWYGSYSGGSVTDPTGASSGSNRVTRGGSWSYEAAFLPPIASSERRPIASTVWAFG